MQSPVCPEIRGRRDNRKRVTGSVDARGRGGEGEKRGKDRITRACSSGNFASARKNGERQFHLERTCSAWRYCVTRRAERRAKGGGRAEREWVNVRPVGWFVRRREIVSRRNFSEGRAVFLSMLFLASASTDDSRRSSGRSASGPGRKAVSFIAGLLPPNRLFSPFNVVILRPLRSPSCIRAFRTRASLITRPPVENNLQTITSK